MTPAKRIKVSHTIPTIDSLHIVKAHALNSLVPPYLRGITLQGAAFIRLPQFHNGKRLKEK